MLSWQELRAGRSNINQNKSKLGLKDGDSKPSGHLHAFANSKPTCSSALTSNVDESGRSIWKRNIRGTNRQQTSQKQRLFPVNFKNHAKNPNNTVGFLFGSTPPENQGLARADYFFIKCFILCFILLLYLFSEFKFIFSTAIYLHS